MSDYASAIRPSIVMTLGFTLLCGETPRMVNEPGSDIAPIPCPNDGLE